MMRTNFNK